MSLPQSILKQLWQAGYGGQVIRVPVKNERLQLKLVANEVLKDAERLDSRREQPSYWKEEEDGTFTTRSARSNYAAAFT